ncbi:hypothetical protein AN640_06755 [Candidatus Epulonipiscium fishelsonii]|uniref:Uncharacterized protein n=1 Tax=Candidatus Epulonipiscium fishelsonii TaxID=77094 RepID=A0ACC8XHY9_9FIRM|nr:hypothetical protein AN640_06755 [Epulopiscium sp. SCG-D08WGA-EpuloA1]OON90376.1 MAG: hypothetical protein ATN32_04085 [Epulopiscium sp. AS2M-Bin002]
MQKYFDILNRYGNIVSQSNNIIDLMKLEKKFKKRMAKSFKVFYMYYGNNDDVMNKYAIFLPLDQLKILDNGDIIFAHGIDDYLIKLINFESMVFVDKYSNIVALNTKVSSNRLSNFNCNVNEFLLFVVAFHIIMTKNYPTSVRLDRYQYEILKSSKNFKIQHIFGEEFSVFCYFPDDSDKGILGCINKYSNTAVFGATEEKHKILLEEYFV